MAQYDLQTKQWLAADFFFFNFATVSHGETVNSGDSSHVPHSKAAFHRFGHTLLLLLISVLKVICCSVCGKESKLNLGR